MLSVALNQRIEESALPAGEKLAARCAIGALDMLKSVAKALGLALDEIEPKHIADWCVAGEAADEGKATSIDAIWANTFGEDATFFARFAKAELLLRERMVNPDALAILPFRVFGVDSAVCYQLAANADEAGAMAREEGVEVASVEPGWLSREG
jgi:hypothetical protein